MKERISIVKMEKSDLVELIPMMKKAFEESVKLGLGYVDESMLPPESEMCELPFSDDVESYKILLDGVIVGGAIVIPKKEEKKNRLELLFIDVNQHIKGLGVNAWQCIEEMYPDVEIWELETPLFSLKNIHFYVNKCGFHIVEYYNERHPYPQKSANTAESDNNNYGMFRFEKVVK